MPENEKLPADPDGINDERAGWAAVALQAFLSVCPDDEDAALADLLCNLRHWADRAGLDFEAVLRGAMRCYFEETAP